MTLSGKVQSAPSGSLGFDTSSKVSLATAKQFHAQGYKYAIRYLSLGSSETSDDLTTSEAKDILNANLALMPVQHVRTAGWTPSGSLGTTYGKNAAKHASEIGFPKGVNVWLDLEGVKPGTSAKAVSDYANNWYDEVAAAGYTPGIYIGADSVLDSSQLYNNLKVSHYWKSLSEVPDVAKRGYQMVQSATTTVNGIEIEPDKTQTDKLGGQAQWLVS